MVANFPNDDIQFEGHLRLGLLFLTKKRYEDAITSFSIAIRSPEDRMAALAQFKLGEAYLEGGNRDLAALQFSKVVYLYPQQAEVMEEALLKLGTLYVEEKKFSEAKQVYKKLLEKTHREDRREMAKKMLDQIQ